MKYLDSALSCVTQSKTNDIILAREKNAWIWIKKTRLVKITI